jgi:hypothetical protein
MQIGIYYCELGVSSPRRHDVDRISQLNCIYIYRIAVSMLNGHDALVKEHVPSPGTLNARTGESLCLAISPLLQIWRRILSSVYFHLKRPYIRYLIVMLWLASSSLWICSSMWEETTPESTETGNIKDTQVVSRMAPDSHKNIKKDREKSIFLISTLLQDQGSIEPKA